MRISRDAMLMECAEAIAKRGTCTRLQVGAVFSTEGRILITGYNGSPAGLPHCEHGIDWPADQPCLLAEHAERNGIAFAARCGVALGGAEVHVTHAPCYTCAMALINAGVKRVLFKHDYRKADGLHLLSSSGIETLQYP